jgi:hypothetical protein
VGWGDPPERKAALSTILQKTGPVSIPRRAGAARSDHGMPIARGHGVALNVANDIDF